MMQIALGAQGFSTMDTTHETIYQAIDSFRPDLVILEFDLTSKIKPTTYEKVCLKLCMAKIPIVLVSSSNMVEDYAVMYKADAYTMKPLDYTDLCNTVKDVLSL